MTIQLTWDDFAMKLNPLALDVDLLRKAAFHWNGDAKEEAAVLQAVLTLEGKGAVQVAMRRSHLQDDQSISHAASEVRKNMAGVKDETIFDFIAKNCPPLSDEDPQWNIEGVILLDERKERSIFRDTHQGWDRFRERFPDSNGVMQLSRVGFDRGVSQALLCFGVQFDWLIGLGKFMLLTRDRDGWRRASELNAWRS